MTNDNTKTDKQVSGGDRPENREHHDSDEQASGSTGTSGHGSDDYERAGDDLTLL